MPGNELKRKLSQLPGLFKSLSGKAEGVLRSPHWHRRAAWSVGGLLLLWALAYALMPVVLKSQLEKTASEKLGRQVAVGAVDFLPWSLELTLSDLAIAKAGSPLSPEQSQLKIRRLYIDAEMQSLLRLAPVADAIELDGLALSVTHLARALRHRDNAMRELAVQRAVAVRDYLAVSGIAPGRLFLGAPKSVPAGAKWIPRAELNLAMP